MFKGYLESLVSSLASKYIANLDISALSVGLFSGDVVLRNVELKLEVLRREFAAGLPIQFRRERARLNWRSRRRTRPSLWAPLRAVLAACAQARLCARAADPRAVADAAVGADPGHD